MNSETILYLIVGAPLLGAFVLPLVGKKSEVARNWLAFLFVATSFVLSLKLVPLVLRGDVITISKALPLGFDFVFVADGLAVFMACVSSFISSIILLYSFDYISHYGHRGEYYFMVVLFLGSMMGLVFAGNLIYLYVFWELTAITSWRLIGFFRERDQVIRADKAFLVTVFGALLMLLGFIILYQQTFSFDLAALKAAKIDSRMLGIAVCLILAGILSKSATLPFHTWLPDAGVAPSPVTALLHAAILVKIGVYVFARLFVATIHLDVPWEQIIPAIAGVSAIVSAGAALIDTDIKRIIAYSTISQIGFIFLGLASGTEIGVAGGLLYILMHGLAKAGLFLCAGIIEQNTKTKDIREMGGLLKVMPVTAISFLLCSFSVMGIPPFGGFFCKYMVFSGALKDGLWIALLFLAGAFMTILYLLRLFSSVFLGELKRGDVKERSWMMVGSVALFAALSLVGGILIAYPNDMVMTVVKQMTAVVQ
jgi:proton-translocating NADH-quinone oxidoreductase chain N